MQSLKLIQLGTHRILNPDPGEPPFLSAASGVAWSPRSGLLRSVGDDQAAVAEFSIAWTEVQEALRLGEDRDILSPGTAQRIIPEVLPLGGRERSEAKADFEALTIITRDDINRLSDGNLRMEMTRRFPNGLLLIVGSGGMSWGGVRRSIGVVYSLGENGLIRGLPAKISFEGLHTFLDEHIVIGELNIEGVTVHGSQLVLAQRGNSFDQDGAPAPNMLIRLALDKFLWSLCTDLKIDQLELEELGQYDLGSADYEGHLVKLDFTDVDSVHEDPKGRMVITGAAEANFEPIKGQIAGSIVGVIDAEGNLVKLLPLEDQSIKLEGVDARYNHTLGCIDVLLVPDADDPDVPAGLYAARILD